MHALRNTERSRGSRATMDGLAEFGIRSGAQGAPGPQGRRRRLVRLALVGFVDLAAVACRRRLMRR
jgi:hypothetical protein